MPERGKFELRISRQRLENVSQDAAQELEIAEAKQLLVYFLEHFGFVEIRATDWSQTGSKADRRFFMTIDGKKLKPREYAYVAILNALLSVTKEQSKQTRQAMKTALINLKPENPLTILRR